MTFGEYLQYLRVNAGMTLEEVASRLNPPLRTSGVSKWEKGRVSNIKRSHIEQLAKMYGVSPVDLVMYGSESKSPIEAKYERLDAFDQGKLMGYADMLLDQEKYKK